MAAGLSAFANETYCYLTTTGRVTGRPHRIEIWFAVRGDTLYMLAGGREKADWVRNALKQPRVTIEIRDAIFELTARQVTDAAEDALARRLLHEKYTPIDDDLDEWSRTALPMAFE